MFILWTNAVSVIDLSLHTLWIPIHVQYELQHQTIYKAHLSFRTLRTLGVHLQGIDRTKRQKYFSLLLFLTVEWLKGSKVNVFSHTVTHSYNHTQSLITAQWGSPARIQKAFKEYALFRTNNKSCATQPLRGQMQPDIISQHTTIMYEADKKVKHSTWLEKKSTWVSVLCVWQHVKRHGCKEINKKQGNKIQ